MILILGYLGYGNYGDEILADLLEAKLKEKYGQKEEIRRLSSRDSLWQHLVLLYKADKVYAIGGMFQDLSGGFSVLYYFLVFLSAYLMHSKIIVFAQGIGPLSSAFNRLLVYWALRLSSTISIRDASSAEMLRDLNIEHLAALDWAWLYADEIIDIDFHKLPKLNLETKPLVLALRPSKFIDEKFLDNLAIEIDSIGLPVVSFVMQDCDREINQKLIARLDDCRQCVCINAADFLPQEIIYFFKNYCSVIYSMRLHAAILARIAGLEINLIDCDPKLTELSEQLKDNDLDDFIRKARLSEKLLQ